MRTARQALPKAVLAAYIFILITTLPSRSVSSEIDKYIISANRQWVLMQVGNFDEAKQVDFQEVRPQFDLMQHQVPDSA